MHFPLRLLALGMVAALFLTTGCAGGSPAEESTSADAPATSAASGMGGGMAGGAGGEEGMVSGVVAAREKTALELGRQSPGAGGVTVARVLAPTDGWLVVSSLSPTGPVLGSLAVKAGENRNLVVPLTAADARSVRVELHADRGRRGVLEFDPERVERSADRLILVDEKPVGSTVELAGFGAETQPHLIQLMASDQRVSAGVVHVEQLIAPSVSWLAVHELEKGVPGRLLGTASVTGETFGVDIPVRNAKPGEVVVTMFADLGQNGRFEYDPADPLGSPDQPYTLGGQVVAQRIRLR